MENQQNAWLIILGGALAIVCALICLYQTESSVKKIEEVITLGIETKNEIIPVSNETAIISNCIDSENLPFVQFIVFSCGVRVYLGWRPYWRLTFIKDIIIQFVKIHLNFWSDRPPTTTPVPRGSTVRIFVGWRWVDLRWRPYAGLTPNLDPTPPGAGPTDSSRESLDPINSSRSTLDTDRTSFSFKELPK